MPKFQYKVTFTKRTDGAYSARVTKIGVHGASVKEDVFSTFEEAQSAERYWLGEMRATGHMRVIALKTADHFEEIDCGSTPEGRPVFARRAVVPSGDWL